MKRHAWPNWCALIWICLTIFIAADCAAKEKKVNSNERETFVMSLREAIDTNLKYKELRDAKNYSEKYSILRKKRVNYLETTFSKMSTGLKKYLSLHDDVQLAKLLLSFDLSLAGSADESVSFVVGDIFVNNPEPLIKAYSQFSKEDKEYLYESISWGVMNYDQKELTEAQISKYKNELLSLKQQFEMDKKGP